jgi:chemotaxis receptor (MCP) glutamine deamidase CheD
MQMATDVDMDEDEKTIVSKKTSIGTTGLACCIAVCIYGKRHKIERH